MASEDTKQIKVVGFYITIITLALIFFWYKGCERSGDGCEAPSNCRDEFIPEEKLVGSSSSQCAPGANAEIVTEPKRGVLCRCHKKGQ